MAPPNTVRSFTSKAGVAPVHSRRGGSFNIAGVQEQGQPGLLLLGEKEHDVHKGNRLKTTESAGSGVIF